MRRTVASAIALATSLVMALCMLPDNHAPKVIDRAVADPINKPPSEGVQAGLGKPTKAAHERPDDLTAKTEAELNEKFGAFNFTEKPLNEVLEYFQKNYCGADIFFDRPALKDSSIDTTKTLVTLSFAHIRLKTFLDLLLGEFGMGLTIPQCLYQSE